MLIFGILPGDPRCMSALAARRAAAATKKVHVDNQKTGLQENSRTGAETRRPKYVPDEQPLSQRQSKRARRGVVEDTLGPKRTASNAIAEINNHAVRHSEESSHPRTQRRFSPSGPVSDADDSSSGDMGFGEPGLPSTTNVGGPTSVDDFVGAQTAVRAR